MTLQLAFALNTIELDAFTEVANIGASRAASSLRSLAGSEVVLSVPSVDILTYDRAAQLVGEGDAGNLVAVHQYFNGEISGAALLIFPETKSLEFVREITGGDLPLEEVIAMEHEALAETGNIILNGCLATIANMRHQSLNISLPEVIHGSGPEIFSRASGSVFEITVLFRCFNFFVRRRAIEGYIAMLLDLSSLHPLRALIQGLILGAPAEPSS